MILQAIEFELLNHNFIINKLFIDIPAQLPNLPRPRKRLTELMLKSLSEQTGSSSSGKNKRFLPIFLRAPKAIGENEVELTVTKLQNDTAVATDQIEHLQTDLVLRSIGYKSTCVDGGICFDERSGRVYNENGEYTLRLSYTNIIFIIYYYIISV